MEVLKNNMSVISDYLTSEWVDEQLSQLSLEEKIAQCFQVAAFSNRGDEHVSYVLELVEKYKIGGLTFFQGTPKKQAMLTNLYQQKTKVPLLIFQDAEWGLGMRLQESMSFPYQMTLGALNDNSLIEDLGRQIAKHCQAIGVHSNLGPVVDINTNPNNPVINYRSFGENTDRVIEKAQTFIKGLESERVLAVAKHFPGHGDTDLDSHLELPVLSHELKRLKEVELAPYQKLFKEGLNGIMTAHLHIPALDKEQIPATLSENVVGELLRKEMGFEGISITDALDMKGVACVGAPGIIDLMAFKAGNDILLNSLDVPKGIAEIKRAIKNGDISEEVLEKKCRKILALKEWVGLANWEQIQLDGLEEKLFDTESERLNVQIARQSLTALRLEVNLQDLKKQEKPIFIHVLADGPNMQRPQELQHHLNDFNKSVAHEELITMIEQEFSGYTNIYWSHESKEKLVDVLQQYTQHRTPVLCGIHALNIKPKNRFGLSDEIIEAIDAQIGSNLWISLFGNPYALAHFSRMDQAKLLVTTYQESIYTYRAFKAFIEGHIEAQGTLPVTIH